MNPDLITEGLSRTQVLAYSLLGALFFGFGAGCAYALFARPVVKAAETSRVRQVTPPRGEMGVCA